METVTWTFSESGSLMTDHHNKSDDNGKVWNIVRITKMWHRRTKWANAVGKMTPIEFALHSVATNPSVKIAVSVKYSKSGVQEEEVCLHFKILPGPKKRGKEVRGKGKERKRKERKGKRNKKERNEKGKKEQRKQNLSGIVVTPSQTACWPTEMPGVLVLFYFFIKTFFNVYLFLRERQRQSVSRGGAERGRHRIRSRLRALSCRHRVRPRGSNSRAMRSWPEVRCLTDSTTQAPLGCACFRQRTPAH